MLSTLIRDYLIQNAKVAPTLFERQDLQVADLALGELLEYDGIVLLEWGDVVSTSLGDHLQVLLQHDADDDLGDDKARRDACEAHARRAHVGALAVTHGKADDGGCDEQRCKGEPGGAQGRAHGTPGGIGRARRRGPWRRRWRSSACRRPSGRSTAR